MVVAGRRGTLRRLQLPENPHRFPNKNRSRSFKKNFSIAITIAFSKQKSLIDFAGKNANRFSGKKRDPLVKS